jgi:hypothetical protein
MKLGKAFLAGVTGGAVLSILLAIVRAAGMPATIELNLGSMITGSLGPAAYGVGLVAHLVLSGLIGLLYGIGFEYLTKRAGVGIGTAFGVIHALIGGVLMGLMPVMHPLMPSQLPAPGPFMINFGAMGVAMFVGLHLIFGAIVGGMYGPVDQPGEEPVEDPLDPLNM